MSSSMPPHFAMEFFLMFQEKLGMSFNSFQEVELGFCTHYLFAREQRSEVIFKLIKGNNLRRT